MIPFSPPAYPNLFGYAPTPKPTCNIKKDDVMSYVIMPASQVIQACEKRIACIEQQILEEQESWVQIQVNKKPHWFSALFGAQSPTVCEARRALHETDELGWSDARLIELAYSDQLSQARNLLDLAHLAQHMCPPQVHVDTSDAAWLQL